MNGLRTFLKGLLEFKLSLGARWFLFGITFLGLGLFYFWKLSPILHWIHSDNAIPYLMANTPFDWGDMYIWGTGRNGAPYSFFAKLLFLIKGSPLDPAIFYWTYILLVLLALSLLWVTPLHHFIILLLLLLLLPMTGQGVHNLLLPGQPYSGIIVFMAMTLVGCFLHRPLILCLGILLLFIQHALAGMLAFAIATGFILEERTLWSEKVGLLFTGLLGSTSLFIWFKSQAPTTDGFKWLNFSPPDQIIASLKIIFTQYGLVLDTQWKYLGLSFLAFILASGFYLIFKKRGFSGYYWGGLLIGWTLCGLLIIGSSRWFFLNAHDHRYIHAISLGAATLLIIILQRNLIPQGIAALFLFAILMLKPMPYLYTRSQDPTGAKAHQSQIIQEAQGLGCKGIVGGQWDTYFIGAVTQMGILGSPFPYLRNKKFLNEVLSRSPLCWVDSEESRNFLNRFEELWNLNCLFSDQHPMVFKCYPR
jgi:hypothetical protein